MWKWAAKALMRHTSIRKCMGILESNLREIIIQTWQRAIRDQLIKIWHYILRLIIRQYTIKNFLCKCKFWWFWIWYFVSLFSYLNKRNSQGKQNLSRSAWTQSMHSVHLDSVFLEVFLCCSSVSMLFKRYCSFFCVIPADQTQYTWPRMIFPKLTYFKWCELNLSQSE